MSRLPRITGREAPGALKRAGFVEVRIEGSHHHLHRAGGSGVVTIAVHAGKVLKPGTLRPVRLPSTRLVVARTIYGRT